MRICGRRATGGWSSMTRRMRSFASQSRSRRARHSIRCAGGLLLHERFNNKDAVDLFKEALQAGSETRRRIWGWRW